MNKELNILEHPEPKYKDTLFRMIFGGKEKRSAGWRLELYNALSGKNHTNPDDLELTTIENVIFITMKNDVSFLIDSQMNLYEHQSTYNPNMPLRGLLYFSQLYQIYLTKQKKDLFGSLVKIPSPEYIVFYNGKKELPDTIKLRLSDAFINPTEKGDFEWTAKIININPEYNQSLHKKCKPLYDYIRYIDYIKTSQQNGVDIKQAVEKAVDWAITENLLEGFFREQKAEVIAMILTEFDQENYDMNRRQEGYIEGFEKGQHESSIKNAERLLEMNILSVEQISTAVELPVEEVEKISQRITK